jgi:ketosteroid isomerase-like protein
MSEENVEIVRRGYKAFSDADLETLLNLMDPEIEVVPPRSNPDWQLYHGHEGFLAFAGKWFEPWDDYRIEPEELIDCGDPVVAVTRDTGSNAGGLSVEQRLHTVWTIRNGRAVRMEMFYEHGEALEAAGLSE